MKHFQTTVFVREIRRYSNLIWKRTAISIANEKQMSLIDNDPGNSVTAL